MQRSRDLIGKAVVSADRGEKVGTVSDVLVQPDAGRIAGLVVHTGLMRSEVVLPFGEIQVLGQDAVVAKSRDATVRPSEWAGRAIDARRSTRLRHRRVITRSGREVGEISDVYVDEISGALDGYEVETPGFAGLIHHHARLPYSHDLAVGDDAMVVPDDVAETLTSRDGGSRRDPRSGS